MKPYGRWKLCGKTGRGVEEGRPVEKQFLRIPECDTVAAQIGHHNEMKRPVSTRVIAVGWGSARSLTSDLITILLR